MMRLLHHILYSSHIQSCIHHSASVWNPFAYNWEERLEYTAWCKHFSQCTSKPLVFFRHRLSRCQVLQVESSRIVNSALDVTMQIVFQITQDWWRFHHQGGFMVSHTAFYVTTLSANCKPSCALICWLWCFTGGRQVCCCHLLYCKSRFLFWFLCGVTNIKFHRFCPLHYTSACLLFLFVPRFSSFLLPG